MRQRTGQRAASPSKLLDSTSLDPIPANEIAPVMLPIRTNGAIQRDLDAPDLSPDPIYEPAPAPAPENGAIGEQVGALGRLMLGTRALNCPKLPARSLAQRLKLAWSTFATVVGASSGEAMCAVAGDFFPGHYGDFEATIVTSKWDALRTTVGGLTGFVLKAELPRRSGESGAAPEAMLPVDEPSRVRGSFTRNNLFQLFGKRHGVDVVLHAGSTKAAKRSLARHYLGLTRAAQVLGKSSGLLIPEVLQFGDVGGVRLLVQSAVVGRPFKMIHSEAEIHAKVEFVVETVGAAFAQLVDRNARPEGEFLGDICKRMRVALADAYIADVINQARAWQRQTKVGSTFCHGDLWFPNIIFPFADISSPGRIGLIDWEWARPDGVPGYDALHLVALVLAEVCRMPLGSAFRMVGHPERLPGWLRSIVTSIARIYGLEREDLEAISRLLLLIRIWQGHFVTYSGGEKWLTDLVRAYRDVNP